MKLVAATLEDIPAILEQGETFIQQCGNPHVKWNEQHITQLCTWLIGNGVLVCAKSDEGEMAGFVGAMYNQSILDPSCVMLQEVFWWVVPKYRKGRAAWLLMQCLKQLGKKYGLPVVMCTTADSPDMSKGFAKQQFKPLEQMFMRSPDA